MSNRRFEMYQYRQIIIRLRLGDSDRSIARTRIADRKTIRRIRLIAQAQGWLNKETELPDDNVLYQSLDQRQATNQLQKLIPYQTQVENWYQQGIQASTIHAALQRQHGFRGSYNTVQRFIKSLKAQQREITTILEFKPGECAQIDFGAGPKLIDETTGETVKTWIFVMVLSWSRHMYAEIVLNQTVETWLSCHRHAFEWFGGVPKKLIIDNAKCAITKACYYDPVVQRSYAEYAEGYGFIISACPPREPKKKGQVESGVKFVKNNFVPLRIFRHLIDSNHQLRGWLLETAGNRIHGTTREKPLTLFETERGLLTPLPDNPPELAVWEKVTLHGDCHVMFLKCRYSAPYKLVRELLWLRATDTTVRIYQDHTLVAIHPRLVRPGTKSTLDEHLPPNAQAYAMRDSSWCLEQAKRVGLYCHQVVQQLLTDSVVDYLRAAQGIVGLQKKYGNERLNAACQRALVFQSVHYKTIKSILIAGAEYKPLPEQEAFDTLAETYTGQGRFCRDTSKLMQ
jgi:transposase